MDHADEVRAFLRSRRARLQPSDVGLPLFGMRRHVPGLRREEVAMLAGVSTEYYARMERGQVTSVSEQVLSAVADALRLDDAEREHLANLAHAVPAARSRRRPRSRRGAIDPVVAGALRGVTHLPAFVRNAAMDVLAVNDLGQALYPSLFDGRAQTPNFAEFTLLDPAARTFYADWTASVDFTVAVLRHGAGRYPDDERIIEVVGALATKSDTFRARWARGDVLRHAGSKAMHHPVVGDIELQLFGAQVMGHDDLALMMYVAEADSDAEQQLRLLETWSATHPTSSGVV